MYISDELLLMISIFRLENLSPLSDLKQKYYILVSKHLYTIQVIIEWIIKKSCVKSVLLIHSPFLRPSFFRLEKKREKNNRFVVHLLIQYVITFIRNLEAHGKKHSFLNWICGRRDVLS